jgi:hypothetical protein
MRYHCIICNIELAQDWPNKCYLCHYEYIEKTQPVYDPWFDDSMELSSFDPKKNNEKG